MTDTCARQTRPNEVVISDSADAAADVVAHTINRLGRVKRREGSQAVHGRIKYGLQSVKICASLVERVRGQTTIVIQASGDDVWGAAAKNATERLVEMLLNLDNPGYQPDRLGMHPGALVGFLIGFVLLVLFGLRVVFPLMGINLQ